MKVRNTGYEILSIKIFLETFLTTLKKIVNNVNAEL